MDDKKVPEYLTRKDLRSLGINDNFRDELAIDFNNVKTKKRWRGILLLPARSYEVGYFSAGSDSEPC